MTCKDSATPCGCRSVSEHRVQLFDTVESRVAAVARYLAEGAQEGDTLLVVIASRHWAAVAERLQASVQTTRDDVSHGRMVMMDASVTLARLMRDGRPDAGLFTNTVGRLVAHLVTERRRLRIYGEMVDLLAEQGDFKGAQRLEGFWNELAAQQVFTLLCGYSAVHFGDPQSAASLDAICGEHSRVEPPPASDRLAAWVLKARLSERPAAPQVSAP